MVTDEIMAAVDMVIGMLKTKEERRAGNSIMEMLGDLDEDKWLCMTNEQKSEWVSGYINDSK